MRKCQNSERRFRHQYVTRWTDQTRLDNSEEQILDFNRDMSVEQLKALVQQNEPVIAANRVLAVETRYRSEDYEAKRRSINDRLRDILNELFDECYPVHLRVEFVNLISYVATMQELFGMITTVHNAEKQHLTCELLDKFENNFAMIKENRRNTFVDMQDFAGLLDFRDEVMLIIQSNCRNRRQALTGKEQRVPRQGCERYSPYDYEWLCGSVVSGPYHLTCAKFLCVTRIAQLNMSNIRSEILGVKKGFEFEFALNIRVPLPEDPSDPVLLASALLNRESCLRDINMKVQSSVMKTSADDLNYKFTKDICDYEHMRADIRRKKKNIGDLLLRTERSACAPYFRIMGVLSMVEAQLLMLHKVHALFMDKKYGMYGTNFPRSIQDLCFQLFLNTNAENCKDNKCSRKIRELLKQLRKETRAQIRTYYAWYEGPLERNYTEPCNINIDKDENHFTYNITVEDFPVEIAPRIRNMVKSLYLEEHELWRLNNELNMVKQGIYDWPTTEGTPAMVLNTCKRPIDAFHGNFSVIYPQSIVDRVLKHSLSIQGRLTADLITGAEIIRVTGEVMESAKCVPSVSELQQQFVASFKKALGDKVVEGLTASDLAYQLSDIVNQNIAITQLRKKYPNPKGTAATARNVVQPIVELFVEMIETHETFLKRKSQMPQMSIGHLTSEMINHPASEFIRTLMCGAEENGCSSNDQEEEEEEDEEEEEESFHQIPDPRLAAFLHAVAMGPATEEELLDVARRRKVDVPDHMIEAFLSKVVSVNLGPIPDMSDPIYNLPVD